MLKCSAERLNDAIAGLIDGVDTVFRVNGDSGVSEKISLNRPGTPRSLGLEAGGLAIDTLAMADDGPGPEEGSTRELLYWDAKLEEVSCMGPNTPGSKSSKICERGRC